MTANQQSNYLFQILAGDIISITYPFEDIECFYLVTKERKIEIDILSITKKGLYMELRGSVELLTITKEYFGQIVAFSRFNTVQNYVKIIRNGEIVEFKSLIVEA